MYTGLSERRPMIRPLTESEMRSAPREPKGDYRGYHWSSWDPSGDGSLVISICLGERLLFQTMALIISPDGVEPMCRTWIDKRIEKNIKDRLDLCL